MPSGQSAAEIRERIKQSPHWRITIRPAVFNAQLIPALPDCWKMIESSAVSLRGWDYPHVDRSDRANRKDWIASWCEFMDHREYWQFFQSGQFAHLFSFREDRRNALPTALSQQLVEIPTGEEPTGCMDIIETLFRITEIYEFASRLSQKMALEGSISISVELVQVKSRILTVLDPRRAWWGYYPSVEENLTHTEEIGVAELIGNSAQLALDGALWFFHRFQWNDPSLAVLQSDQQKLLTRSLR
jgi:hypothetical protein